MTSTLKREPLPVGYDYKDGDEIREDTYACNLMCAGQILYMFGLIDTFTLADLNERVGRNYGDTENARSTELLYMHGLTAHVIEPENQADLERWIESYTAWLEDGRAMHPDADLQDDEQTRETYGRWLVFVRGVLNNRARYDHLISYENRPAYLRDIDTLLEQGWLVVVTVYADTDHFIPGVIYDKQGDAYLVYDPNGQLSMMTDHELLAVDDGSLKRLTAWKPAQPTP